MVKDGKISFFQQLAKDLQALCFIIGTLAFQPPPPYVTPMREITDDSMGWLSS